MEHTLSQRLALVRVAFAQATASAAAAAAAEAALEAPRQRAFGALDFHRGLNRTGGEAVACVE